MNFQAYYTPDVGAYQRYYLEQAGGSDIPKFRGQYGYGLGSLLRSFIKTIFPIGKSMAKSAFNIAKPHLQAAAGDLTKEATKAVINKINKATGQSGGRKRKKSCAKTQKAKKSKTTRRKTVRNPIKRATVRANASNVLNSLPNIF